MIRKRSQMKLFTNIGQPYASDIPSSKFNFDRVMGNKYQQNMFLAPTERKNSSGHYGRTAALIKDIQCEIPYPLTILINKSLSNGIFPESLKIAKVIPIYKSKDRKLLIIIYQYHYYQPFPKYLRK